MQRQLDIVAERVVATFNENGSLQGVEIYGQSVDGASSPWIWIHTPNPIEIKVAVATD